MNDFIFILTGKKVLGSSAGHGKGKAKKSSSVTVNATITATSAGNQGRKRKSDLTQEDDELLEHPPAKRGKAKALPADQQRMRPVPRPVQKNTQRLEVAMGPATRCNTKKRPSEATDLTHENDPKTPVPSKKAKIPPIRRTGEPFSFSTNGVDKKARNNGRVSWIQLGCSEAYRHRPEDCI